MKKTIKLSVALLFVAAGLQAQNTFPSTGSVGVGTTQPTSVLHVKHTGAIDLLRLERDIPLTFRVQGESSGSTISYGAEWAGNHNFTYTNTKGASMIGFHQGALVFFTSSAGRNQGVVGDIIPEMHYSKGRMMINKNGQVGIGMDFNPSNTVLGFPSDTDYKLAVKGKIMTEELKVQLSNSWPDYVFDKDYSLLSLKETEDYIKKNKHLPGVPSAEEVAVDKGIEVGEMNRILLEKVEELYLHVIKLQKELETIKK